MADFRVNRRGGQGRSPVQGEMKGEGGTERAGSGGVDRKGRGQEGVEKGREGR